MRHSSPLRTCLLFLFAAGQHAALFADPPRAVAPFDAAAERAHQTGLFVDWPIM